VLILRVKGGREVLVGDATIRVLHHDPEELTLDVDGLRSTLRPQETLLVEGCVVRFITGGRGGAKMGFDAPRSVPITRI
jgi:sRNA-binding carbon storage regulator CsrA